MRINKRAYRYAKTRVKLPNVARKISLSRKLTLISTKIQSYKTWVILNHKKPTLQLWARCELDHEPSDIQYIRTYWYTYIYMSAKSSC
jgi:hypothetical protein